MDSTAILATTVRAVNQPDTPGGMVPLTVRYQERASATGRIPTNFLRRELSGLSDTEILTSRAIDRSVRPFFPAGYRTATDLTATLIAADGRVVPDVLSINAASAALAVSSIPWEGPIAAVRVGVTADEDVLINPRQDEKASLLLNLLIVCSRDQRVVMMELAGRQARPHLLHNAIVEGARHASDLAVSISEFAKEFGKEKVVQDPVEMPQDLVLRFEANVAEKLKEIIGTPTDDKQERGKRLSDLRKEFVEAEGILPEEDASSPRVVSHLMTAKVREFARKLVVETGKRSDGRACDELRPITCEMDLYPALHGTGMFTKGQTQVLATVTLDSKDSAFRSDPVSMLMGAPKEKRFMAHYQFNDFATNELISGASQGYRRRDLGHSRLIENALIGVVPQDYPFTIRLVCDVLESAGSSSMGSVCAGFLALKDAGIPLDLADGDGVAGVALGTVVTDDEAHAPVLLDITGFEDFINDMDFKVASSKLGFVAGQLDCKVKGICLPLVIRALDKAKLANDMVIDQLVTCVGLQVGSRPKPNGPVEEELVLPGQSRAILMRNGAYLLKKIQEESGVRISTVDENTFSVFAHDSRLMTVAKKLLDKYLIENSPGKDLEFGGIYSAKVLEIQDRGVLVSILPGISEAFVPLRQMDSRRMASAKELHLTVGQEIQIKYFGLDPQTGKPRLSRKLLQRLSVK